jgi:hypothetical protein
MQKLSTKINVRLANGHRVASTKVCDISFTVAQHDFVRSFHVFRHLRAADIVLGLPWLAVEQATLEVGGAERLPSYSLQRLLS